MKNSSFWVVEFFKNMKKSLGNKRKEISDEGREELLRIFKNFEENEFCNIYPNEFFGYTKVTIEQPKIENGKVVTDRQGNPKPDSSKRDYERVPLSDDIDEYILPDKRKLYLLGEGRLINLAAAEGHPSAVMDMSFANQALCVEYLSKKSKDLNMDVHNVPNEIDNLVGSLKLQSMNMYIDKLTPQQQKYLTSWSIGT